MVAGSNPGLIWVNLLHFILRVLERSFEFLLLRPQGPVFVAWKWFERVKMVGFSNEKCCQIYPRMKFLEQNIES
jgi:hypothetical protein